MIGLVYLAVFVVYLLVALWLVFAAVRFARARGIAGWKFGVPVAIVMYLLVFWDHVPTMLVHDYECRNKAGLVVFKTPEQWKAEHPDEVALVRPVEGAANFVKEDGSTGFWLSTRFIRENAVTENFLLPVRVLIDSIIDSKTREVVANFIWVDSGYPAHGVRRDWRKLKGWVGEKACNPGLAQFVALQSAYRDVARGQQ